MPFSINTNVESLQAQNYLQTSSAFQGKTISEVTSGLRITQSGDDAAGLAIANGYQAQEAVLTQGLQNATDGQSQLQIMDGGMSNITQLLDRASTLASESATGTFTGSRGALNTNSRACLVKSTGRPRPLASIPVANSRRTFGVHRRRHRQRQRQCHQ